MLASITDLRVNVINNNNKNNLITIKIIIIIISYIAPKIKN